MRVGWTLCSLVLISCSRMPVSSSLPPDIRSQSAKTALSFQTLYVFKGPPDGAVPQGRLAGLNGVLYGTTNYGGDSTQACYPGNGCGTVYKMASGTETVLYRFKLKAHGVRPYAGLASVKATLYGTTQEGGQFNQGTVFAITLAGSQRVIFSFNGTDGSYPRASLANINGVLYGTTYFGGSNGYGTIFSVITSGTQRVLHSFSGVDGAQPVSGLVVVNNVLYGTTLSGGADNYGTVFAVNSKGKEHLLHSFTEGTDGAHPWSELTDYNGTLYGTTKDGGASGNGTVFKITTAGAESVVYSFAGGNDGAHPYAGLTLRKGLLYGDTAYGGSSGNDGTIYSVTPSGSERVLYRFTGGSDGRLPYASLLAVKGALYGTTLSGGGTGVGDGTLFKLTP